jgi:hypothetical protein
MEKFYIRKLILLTYNHQVDIQGELMVDNQSLPYEYPKLHINIDESCYKNQLSNLKKNKNKIVRVIWENVVL